MSSNCSIPGFLCLLTSGLLLSACSNTGQDADQRIGPVLGSPIASAQIDNFDLIIEPDGTGLPAGEGTAAQGAAVFQARCQTCHGERGEGRSAATVLTGGSMQDYSAPLLRTVGSYWPYATTLYDFIRRAMPADAPKSLSNAEVYQVSAYVLYLNGLVTESQVLNAESLPRIQMPNRNGFSDQSHIQ